MLALDSSYEKREAWAAATEERVAPLKDDPNFVGWFLDNELKWGKDRRSGRAHSAASTAAGTGRFSPRSSTETSFETPGCSIVTP